MKNLLQCVLQCTAACGSASCTISVNTSTNLMAHKCQIHFRYVLFKKKTCCTVCCTVLQKYVAVRVAVRVAVCVAMCCNGANMSNISADIHRLIYKLQVSCCKKATNHRALLQE